MSAPDWRPGASIETLKARARLLAVIRAFFMARDVLEVETPLLCSTTATDPYLASIGVPLAAGMRYLQTSPEFCMKRLLAAGSGPIYQIARAFRADEAGRRHNPEFTLLEWYRPGFSLPQLVDETVSLVGEAYALFHPGQSPAVKRLTYRELFLRHLGLDPFTATDAELQTCAQRAVPTAPTDWDRDGWLNLLMSECLEPLMPEGLCVVSGFPPSQAALARCVRGADGVLVAERAELYVNGMELANGYRELTDPAEQERRFAADREDRRRNGLEALPMPEALLSALKAGLPDCSGIALGLDRLLLWLCGAGRLDDVLGFSFPRC
jgi:lysyl-tRNA synthetase class 2